MAQNQTFYRLMEEYAKTLKSKNEHFSVTTTKYSNIVQALGLQKGESCPEGAKFKLWCKKHFKLEQIGSKQIVYCSKTSCPLVTYEEIFETVKKCHEKVGHSGRDKTWNEVHTNYAGIKHSVIDIFLKTCTACSQRQPSRTIPAGRPMINLEFLLRLQIDLVDMRSQPDGEFKWILHARDHFTKFSWLYPMRTKMAAEVADHLITQFCVFGPPRILQSDNGKEFTAQVINNLSLYGRPRHHESQGCVERGNGDMQMKLGKWMDEHGQEWSKGLKFVTHAINTSVSSTTKTSPYHLVFGQLPRSDCTIWEELDRQGIHEEENLPENILCQLYPATPAVLPPDPATPAVLPPDPATPAVLPPDPATPAVLPPDPATPAVLPPDPATPAVLPPDPATPAVLPPDPATPAVLPPDPATPAVLPPDPATPAVLPPDPATPAVLPPDPATSDNELSLTTDSGSSLNASSTSSKRGKEFILLNCNNLTVATGTEVKNRAVIHGNSVNSASHTVILIDEVMDPSFVPTDVNPAEEPLETGQFVLWSRSEMVEMEDDRSGHKEARFHARKAYLKAAERQQSRYEKRTKKLISFKEGDTVGIKIHKVDGTNTGAKLLPSKVLTTKTQDQSIKLFNVYTTSGIIKNWFRSEELVDMNNVHFLALNRVEMSSLTGISLIQTSRTCTGWQASASSDTSNVCKCKTTCLTNRCCCKKAGVMCGSK